MQSPTALLDADTLFFKRRRIARTAELAGIVIGLSGMPAVAVIWPPLAEWSPMLVGAASFVVCAAFIWAARCTLCGGGIKLNGRTCSRCGHEFSRVAPSVRPA